MEPGIDWSQEIRFSVVMYGGVSLAIYINGVAQELLRLVRATAAGGPPGPNGDPPLLATDEAGDGEQLRGSEKVYRKLGQLLAHGVTPAGTADPAPSDPIRTRFVVDVISGTSAGGINGIYLAKALANGQSMEGLKRLWVTEGDIVKLVNDASSVGDLAPLPPSDPPRSLLNSRRMYQKLLLALREMEGEDANIGRAPGATRAGLVDELELFVTTTDIRGAVIPLRLTDRVVHERRHRNVFRFRYDAGPDPLPPAAAATPAAPGGGLPSAAWEHVGRNDFDRANNPLLAFAGRCTSAFPFAFEPMSLAEAGEVLRLFPATGEPPLDPDRVAEFLHEPGGSTVARRAFGDGGYLDNKPFGYAVDAGGRRRAHRPVQRKLFYIEPSPEHPERQLVPPDPPNAIENVQAALLQLPRYESIREDLQRVLASNRLVDRVQNVTYGLEEDFRRGIAGTVPVVHTAAYANQDLADMIRLYGIGYGGYHRLKVAEVTDRIALSFAAAAGFDVGSDIHHALQYLVRAWRDARYAHYVDAAAPADIQSFNRFLLAYDIRYRLRRLRFLLRQLDAVSADAPDVAVAAETRRRLEPVLASLLGLDRGLDARGDANLLWREPPDADASEAELPPGFPIHFPDGEARRTPMPSGVVPLLEELLRQPDDDARKDFARTILAVPTERTFPGDDDRRWLAAMVTEGAERLAGWVRAATMPASREVRAALDPEAAPVGAVMREELLRQHNRFEEYDLIAFPVLYATDAGEEQSPVEVFRISPDDATPPFDRADKLAGTSLHHFGAFLEARWRRNDMLWGRLDGADRIITALLPGPEHTALRERLIREARMEILDEELKGEDRPEILGLVAAVSAEDDQSGWLREARRQRERRIAHVLRATATPEQLYDYYAKDYRVDRSLDRTAMARTASRATRVIGRMLEDMAEPGSAGRTRAGWLARAGRAGWGLVEVAVPGSPIRAVTQYLASLLALFALVLAVTGVALSSVPLRNLGLTWIGVVLAFLAIQALVENFLHGGTLIRRVARFGVVVLIAGVLYLAVAGARVTFALPESVFGQDLDTLVLAPLAVLVLAAALRETGALARALWRGLARVLGFVRRIGRFGAWRRRWLDRLRWPWRRSAGAAEPVRLPNGSVAAGVPRRPRGRAVTWFRRLSGR